MPLSLNEIRERAIAFTKEWQFETGEHAEAKSFWDDFFNIFGISRRRVASFEKLVKHNGNRGYIDLLWKGTLLIEHKSKGENLDSAFIQAKNYLAGIKENELPRYILVCDFENFRLYDLDDDLTREFKINQLIDNIHLFGFISGYTRHEFKEQDPINVKAAEQMGRLHEKLKEIKYTGHPLEVYLVRILFCLFADDTGIFEKGLFREYLDKRTSPDGSDLAYHIDALFGILNTPKDMRLAKIDEQLDSFPFINGNLFEERLPNAAFDSKMRQILLDCCHTNWSKISPAIFGSMFQSVMDEKARRNFGAHYTSEKNILKVIKPLFLDELWKEFEKLKGQSRKMDSFHRKLSELRFLDPAEGFAGLRVGHVPHLRQVAVSPNGSGIGVDGESLPAVDHRPLRHIRRHAGVRNRQQQYQNSLAHYPPPDFKLVFLRRITPPVHAEALWRNARCRARHGELTRRDVAPARRHERTTPVRFGMQTHQDKAQREPDTRRFYPIH